MGRREQPVRPHNRAAEFAPLGRIGGLIVILCVQAFAGQRPETTKDIPTITREVMNAVVLVVASDSAGNNISQGSGFIVGSDGKVVTNYHVIENASSAIIKLSNGAFYVIQGVIAADKEKDIVVLKAEGKDFAIVSLGDSDKIEVGEEVVAIGSPLSLEATVSNGIVSGIRRLEDGGLNFIQTTAPISPGSSGGALLDMQGEVIGITSLQFILGQNLNFAIPVNYAQPLLSSNGPVIPLASPRFRGNELTGAYSGTVDNTTAALSATFEIRITEQSGNILGCMMVRRPLFGSGQLKGVVHGASVQFVVTSPLFEIAFRGQRSGEGISGTYTVERAATGKQEGTFDLDRRSLDGPPKGFDLSTCPTN
jgi:hypothetical protein